MKNLLLILMLAFSFEGFGQSASSVTITGQKWSVKREPTQVRNVSTTTADGKDWVEHARVSAENAKRGLPGPQPPVGGLEAKVIPGPDRIVYVYEAVLKNAGTKTVRSVTWQYVFFDPGKTRELGRLKFTSLIKIAPGKEKRAVVRTGHPPTKSVDVNSSKIKLEDQYSGEAVIISVEYTDGSVD